MDRQIENELSADLVCIQKVLVEHDGPVYIYDEVLIRNRAKNFLLTFRKYMPTFKQYFAVKATPNKHIMQILKDEGMCFDCSSLTEIELVGQLDTPSEIIYSSNYTSVDEFEEVLCSMSEGILNSDHTELSDIIINLDDIDCLENLVEACKGTKISLPSIISFRYNPSFGGTSSETKSNILGGSDTKFGISKERILTSYIRAKEVGFTKFGIHVMTGSCVLDVDYFKELVDVVFEQVSTISNELGIKFEFVDLGGGIGIPYRPDQNAIDLDLLARTIADAVSDNIIHYNLKFNPTIVMENGRYITGPYGWLVTQCKSIKHENKNFYGLNACMSNLMRPGMYGAYHHIYIPRLIDSADFQQAHVVGTLCENNDWFAKNRKLPIGIKKDDIFIICDTGAHGFSMGFQYNGKKRSAEVLYDSKLGKFKTIREKELTCFF
jgi:diaminopimelate decarboxylase